LSRDQLLRLERESPVAIAIIQDRSSRRDPGAIEHSTTDLVHAVLQLRLFFRRERLEPTCRQPWGMVRLFLTSHSLRSSGTVGRGQHVACPSVRRPFVVANRSSK